VLPLTLPGAGVEGLRILAIGAHPDDIEIGCGGTLLRLVEHPGPVTATFVILTGDVRRAEEAQRAAELFLPGCEVSVRIAGLPDGRLPAHWDEVKNFLEDAATRVGADLILAPSRHDAHQDHRLLAELVTTVWRDHLVLGYELPKWDGDLGRPSVYVPLTVDTAKEKVRRLTLAFSSQVARDWWDEETFLGLARLRGIECRASYAEAFTVHKATLTW